MTDMFFYGGAPDYESFDGRIIFHHLLLTHKPHYDICDDLWYLYVWDLEEIEDEIKLNQMCLGHIIVDDRDD